MLGIAVLGQADCQGEGRGEEIPHRTAYGARSLFHVRKRPVGGNICLGFERYPALMQVQYNRRTVPGLDQSLPAMSQAFQARGGGNELSPRR